MSAHVYRRPYDYALNLRLQARKRLGVGGRNIVEASGSVSVAFVVDGEGLAVGDGDGLVSLAATVSGAGASIANADSSIALSFALAGDAAAIAEADGSVSLVSTLAAEGEGLVFEQLHSRFGADDGAEGANTQLAAEDVDVSLGKEATVRLRQQLDLTGHLTALSGRLYFKRVGDPDTEWEPLATHEPFGASKWGPRRFDYDFASSRLQTHTPDVQRIEKNFGIAGATLTGAPSNLEPRLVTQDGAPCAFIPYLSGDDITQRLVDLSGNFGQWTPLHNGSACTMALLWRPPDAFTDGRERACHNDDGTSGMLWEFTTSRETWMRVRTSGGGFGVSTISASGVFDFETWALHIYTCDGSGGHYLYVNDTLVASQTGVSGYLASDSTLAMSLLNDPASENLEGYTARITGYLQYFDQNLVEQFYAMAKVTYPTLGLP